MEKIVLDGDNLTLKDFIAVTKEFIEVELSEKAISKISNCRKTVEKIVKNKEVVYGITTGFGSLANVSISAEDTEKLQENLIKSHSIGVGEPLSEEIVRGIILLRINTFCKGFSGIKLETVQLLSNMLNKKVYPFIPSKGSVGASGDLIPLSYLALVMLGRGHAFFENNLITGAEALEKVGLSSIKLSSKEGLALNNGTSVMASIAALNVYYAERLFKNAVLSTAMSLEALQAISSILYEKVHKARPQFGQGFAAEVLRDLLKGSNLIDADLKKVQDAYSLRASPVVLGASYDAIMHAKKIVEIELNSATDNPLIFDGKAYAAANFHGQPVALVMDYLKIGVAELGNISERRTARLLDNKLNSGLPAFLVSSSGLNSGFMIPQYAAAALVSENKVLAHPASVDSIPTCANQEDHVSMGTIAARQCLEIIGNVENIIAIEFMCACQAIELRSKSPSPKIAKLVKKIREKVRFLEEDREMHKDLVNMNKMIQEDSLIKISGI